MFGTVVVCEQHVGNLSSWQLFLQRVDAVFAKYKKYDDQARAEARAWATRGDGDANGGTDDEDEGAVGGPRTFFLRGMKKAHTHVRNLIISGRVGDPPNLDMHFYKGTYCL